MTRSILSTTQIHPAIHQKISSLHQDIVEQVQSAIQEHRVVVVGMTQNPVVKSVRKDLSQAGIDYFYLEYGSYFSQWHRRLALKMWTGWPTFPMIFLEGVLLGGAQDVEALIASGELKEQKSSI